jgi:hypothetical protein
MSAGLVSGRLVVGCNARTNPGAGASTSQRTAVTRHVHVPSVYGLQRFGKSLTCGYPRAGRDFVWVRQLAAHVPSLSPRPTVAAAK